MCECGPGMQLSADRHSCQGKSGWGYKSRWMEIEYEKNIQNGAEEAFIGVDT